MSLASPHFLEVPRDTLSVEKLLSGSTYTKSSVLPLANVADLTTFLEEYVRDNGKNGYEFVPPFKQRVRFPDGGLGWNFDFGEVGDANIGWKFHLNVSAENVLYVSEFLNNKHYFHKLFSGGEPENGIVFTVYVGDYSLACQHAEVLSSRLSLYLTRPTARGEYEFESGVIGRFNAGGNVGGDVSRYGASGVGFLKKENSDRADMNRFIELLRLLKSGNRESTIIQEAFSLRDRCVCKVFPILQQQFGSYFSG